MATKISKNARKKDADIFVCPCGGEIKMFTIAKNGKLRNVARCMKCGVKKRRPSDFRE